MNMISIRIDKDLKSKMEKFKHINWSEIIRQTISKIIQNEPEINRAKAVLLNEKVRKNAIESVNTTDIIRKFRNERFGKNNLGEK